MSTELDSLEAAMEKKSTALLAVKAKHDADPNEKNTKALRVAIDDLAATRMSVRKMRADEAKAAAEAAMAAIGDDSATVTPQAVNASGKAN